MSTGDGRGQIEESLRQLLAQVLAVEPAAVDEEFGMATAPGWTSLKQLMLISQVESRFGVSFTTREVGELTSYPKLVRRVRALVGEGPAGTTG